MITLIIMLFSMMMDGRTFLGVTHKCGLASLKAFLPCLEKPSNSHHSDPYDRQRVCKSLHVVGPIYDF